MTEPLPVRLAEREPSGSAPERHEPLQIDQNVAGVRTG